jgi:hypothetical protein
VRHDVKYYMSTSTTNVPEASKEELAIDGKQKKQSKPSKKKKDHRKIIPIVIKEGGSVSNQ